jgi:hypothetical protein
VRHGSRHPAAAREHVGLIGPIVAGSSGWSPRPQRITAFEHHREFSMESSARFVRDGLSLSRWIAATFAAMVLALGGLPAFAGDSNLSLTIAQNPATPADRGNNSFATFDLVLTNNGPNTVNNILLYVNTGEGAAATSANPPCALAPVSSATCTVNPSAITLPSQTTSQPGFIFSITQLANKAKANATVSFYTPTTGPLTVYAFGVGASTASTTTPSAQTGVKATPYPLAALLNDVVPPPNVTIAITQADGPVFRSDTSVGCDLSIPAVDGCGYANYNLKVTNNGPTTIADAFYVDVQGVGTTVQLSDVLGCTAPCSQGTPTAPVNARFVITSLPPGDFNFTVQFTTPSVGNATIYATPVFTGFPNGTTVHADTTTFSNYDDVNVAGFQVPISTRFGGTIKRQRTDAVTGGTYSSVLKIPKDEFGTYRHGLKSSVDELTQNDSCSPSFKICLGSELHIFTDPADAPSWQGSTLADPNNFILHIELTRDYKTFASSGNALHSTVYYTGADNVKVAVKDCGSVDTTDPNVKRCIRRTFISLQKGKKNEWVSGVVTFFIDARENGVYSW